MNVDLADTHHGYQPRFLEKWEKPDDSVSMERQKDSNGCAKKDAPSFP